jgi:RNA-directed DNA polymerase
MATPGANQPISSNKLNPSAIAPQQENSPKELEEAIQTALSANQGVSAPLSTGSSPLVPDRGWAVDFSDLGIAVPRRVLESHLGDPDRLASFKLPDLRTPQDVAELLGVTLQKLRWMAYDGFSSKYSLYHTFTIAKRSGGERTISAPCRMLKQAQRTILREIIDKMPCEGPAHGFVKGHSPLTNARPHVGKGTVINVDLKDFFPNIQIQRAAFVFTSYGYSPAIATILALVCTSRTLESVKQPDSEEIRYEAKGKRALPQGAPTSPGLANQVARRLDRRLEAFAKKIGWTFTRYADDITFSGPRVSRRKAQSVMDSIVTYIENSGFKPHPEKRKIVTQGGRQQVTGYNVNEKVSVPRTYRQNIRRTLHFAERDGLQKQHGYEIEKAHASHDIGKWLLGLAGKILFVRTAHPDLGRTMHRQLSRMIDRDGLREEYLRARHGEHFNS